MNHIKVKHNVEMAHRLWTPQGKCENIHGHSWWVTLSLWGEPDKDGILLEFGKVKRTFREMLDSTFDHKTILDVKDPLWEELKGIEIPGFMEVGFNPTTENFAERIGLWAKQAFPETRPEVEVWETAVNAAVWSEL